ncbi:reverse transcriptase domain-containing protein [Tanacetum coccineum]
MHTRASNSELVEPLAGPQQTLNRRLHRGNRRVPFERRDERPTQPRIVYLPIFDINYFCHFLNILENYNPMDDEPMWASDHVVASTLGSAITIPETANEFAIKEMLRNFHGHNLTKGNIIVIFYHGLNEITQKALNAAAGGSSNSDTDKIMARMDVMTMKMDAQYKELQFYSNHLIPEYDEDDKPIKALSCNILADLGASINLMTYSLYAKLSLETLKPTKISVRLADRSFQHPIGIAKNMLVEFGKFTFLVDFIILKMEEDIKVPLILGRPFLYTADAVIRVKQKQLNLGVGTE